MGFSDMGANEVCGTFVNQRPLLWSSEGSMASWWLRDESGLVLTRSMITKICNLIDCAGRSPHGAVVV